MNTSLPKIVTIVGPTVSGKTSLGVFLAKQFNGEIISADSRQVYRGLDLGTGKEGDPFLSFPRKRESRNSSNYGSPIESGMTIEEIQKYARYIDDIPQYLIDIKDSEEKFNVHDFKTSAELIIQDVIARNRLPFIVGGTGLYIDALVENYEFAGRDSKKKNQPKYQVLQIGIKIPRKTLHTRIDARVDQRVKEGMVEEVKGLLESGVNPDWLISLGLEYKFLTEHLIGKIPNFDEALQELKYAIHAFARRQETWFNHHGEVRWIVDKEGAVRLVEDFI